MPLESSKINGMKHPVASPLLLFLVSVALSLRADSLVWTNTSGGNWSVPANWEPNLVPGGADTVFITNTGTYTVTLDTDASITTLVIGGDSGAQSLSISGHNVTATGQGLVLNHGRIALESGTIAGLAWTVASGGTLNLTGSANIKDLSGVLTNAGRINYSGDQFRLRGARLYNLAGGVVDLQTDNALGWYNGLEEIHNAGLIRKSGGSATTTIYPVLDNVGTVEAQSGTLSWADGGSLGGVFTAAAGTEIVFAGGTVWYRDGVAWGGTGVKRLSG
ncbi:MAG: hypothetical protein NT154_00360, partial [Verrucomicrobia bacterium]|nr:hypothetical protein [Verrucomicrobiota bacterium]